MHMIQFAYWLSSSLFITLSVKKGGREKVYNNTIVSPPTYDLHLENDASLCLHFAATTCVATHSKSIKVKKGFIYGLGCGVCVCALLYEA
jgi:Pyruvate/2-oxoacid:ferredoxin oxidoreductase delta subunit